MEDLKANSTGIFIEVSSGANGGGVCEAGIKKKSSTLLECRWRGKIVGRKTEKRSTQCTRLLHFLFNLAYCSLLTCLHILPDSIIGRKVLSFAKKQKTSLLFSERSSIELKLMETVNRHEHFLSFQFFIFSKARESFGE
jgi:hypothetical protein